MKLYKTLHKLHISKYCILFRAFLSKFQQSFFPLINILVYIFRIEVITLLHSPLLVSL